MRLELIPQLREGGLRRGTFPTLSEAPEDLREQGFEPAVLGGNQFPYRLSRVGHVLLLVDPNKVPSGPGSSMTC